MRKRGRCSRLSRRPPGRSSNGSREAWLASSTAVALEHPVESMMRWNVGKGVNMERGTLQRKYAREVRSGKRECSSLTGLVLLCASVLCTLLVLWPGADQAQEQSEKLSLEAPELVLKGVPFSVN